MTPRTDLQELVALAISRSIRPQVHSRLAGMALAGHKHDGGLVCSVVGEGGVAGARHGLHARVQVGDVEALDVDLQRHRPHTCTMYIVRQVEDTKSA